MTAAAEYWRQVVVIADAGPDLPSPNPSLPGPSALCAACAAVFVVAGVAITLMDPAAAGAAYASNTGTYQLEELQFEIGEGPTIDGFAAGLPLDEPDLAGLGPGRWMAFGPPAAAAGVRSVFSFPLQVGAARVGTLTVYRAEAGPLSDDLHRGLLVVAEMITRLILGWQSRAPEGLLAFELGHEGVYLAVVHQASGMISVQLDVGVGEALARLRARAFANSMILADLAADVVGRRVRFDD